MTRAPRTAAVSSLETMRVLLKWTLIAVTVALLLAGGVALYFARTYRLQAPFLAGSPLLADGRVYLLTAQWTVTFHEDDTERLTDLLVDLWAFDARTAAPLWRRRLETVRPVGTYERALLGAEGDTLWLLLSRGLVAVSMTGATVRNPPLKDLMKERRYFTFDSAGVRATTSDGRTWRFDPQSLTARPADTAGLSATLIEPAYLAPSTSAFVERGLNIPGRWLGLLTAEEAVTFEKQNMIGGLQGQQRRRLWGARKGEGKNFFGTFTTYREFTPLGEEFLDPGLLSLHARGGARRVIWLRDPDSVLILHRDRLGEAGRLRLTRVAGPVGRVVWQTPLPLAELVSLMEVGNSLVLYGTEPAGGRLISLDLATGTLHVHDFADVDHDMEPK